MAIVFKPETHSYTSVDPSENITWTSVTGVISKFKKPFDPDLVAEKSIKNKKSKWYGMKAEDVKEAWKNESQKAVNLGTWYHAQREAAFTSCDTIEKDGCSVQTESYVNWEGISDKMLNPVNHLDDCNLNHYALQLSFYMYMILKHNPKLRPGKMIIEHIVFEEAGKDAYDNRVVLYDEFG